ncbi:MAG: hypothetical protein JWN71_509 [Xanthobacteraceae bacterium]|nr:hypothetical protein [Xanthobacteraceae bacterium]
MKRLVLTTVLCALALPATAKDPGQNSYMIRVMKCVGPSASMELYLPQSVVLKGDDGILSMRPTIGWFTLDLSDVSKGKPLEPVRISLSPDKKSLIVDQYTRGLPPTRIPMTGGTVNFDQRFGTKAKCGAFDRQG